MHPSISLSISLSLLSFFLPLTTAIPFPSPAPRSNTPTHLLGTTFGLPNAQTFDYVIVGGGTAGLLLAARLSEDSTTTVAVVEAGGFYELENGNVSQIPLEASVGSDKGFASVNRAIDWGFSTVPQAGANNATPHYARGRCLGGSSARNYMAYQRGTADSYDLWAEHVGDPSYGWKTFLPYLQKSVGYSAPDASRRASNASAAVNLADLETKSKGRGWGKGSQGKSGSMGGGGEVSVTISNYAQAISSWVQRGLTEIGIKPRNGFTSGALFGSSYVLETIDAETQTRESSETAFLTADVLARGNLVVFMHSMAQKVVFDGGKRATGVEVVTDGMGYLLSAGKEIVLSAGAFQSPQLLMVSGVGPRSTLEKVGVEVVADRPGVGQNMWDHVFFGPSYEVNVVTGTSTNNPSFLAASTQSYLTSHSGILTNSGGDLFAWEKLPRSTPNSKVPTFSNTTLSTLSAFPPDWPEVEYLTVAGYLGDNVDYTTGPTTGNYATVVAAIVAPLSRGTVSISSANATDAPLINPNWLTHPTDQAVAVAAYKRVRSLWATKAMAGVKIGDEVYPGLRGTESDEEILAEVRKAFNTVWHASCTCKMGRKEDPMAVVDTRARVMGVQGLRVVDASAFALLPPGHPVSTIYALAEKIADDIRNNKNA